MLSDLALIELFDLARLAIVETGGLQALAASEWRMPSYIKAAILFTLKQWYAANRRIDRSTAIYLPSAHRHTSSKEPLSAQLSRLEQTVANHKTEQ